MRSVCGIPRFRVLSEALTSRRGDSRRVEADSTTQLFCLSSEPRQDFRIVMAEEARPYHRDVLLLLSRLANYPDSCSDTSPFPCSAQERPGRCSG
jgi:hypothetical protein